MEEIEGTIEAKSKTGDSLMIAGQWYGARFCKDPNVKKACAAYEKGDHVCLGFEQNKEYRNIVKFLDPRNTPGQSKLDDQAAPGKMSQDDYWRTKSENDLKNNARIGSQWAVNAAIELAKANSTFTDQEVEAQIADVQTIAIKLDDIAARIANNRLAANAGQ